MLDGLLFGGAAENVGFRQPDNIPTASHPFLLTRLAG
jgi:hypothetical protein